MGKSFSSSSGDDRKRLILTFIQQLVGGLGLFNGKIVLFVHDGHLTKISVEPHYNVFADERPAEPAIVNLPYGRRWLGQTASRVAAAIQGFGRAVVTVEKGRVSAIEWTTRQQPEK